MSKLDASNACAANFRSPLIWSKVLPPCQANHQGKVLKTMPPETIASATSRISRGSRRTYTGSRSGLTSRAFRPRNGGTLALAERGRTQCAANQGSRRALDTQWEWQHHPVMKTLSNMGRAIAGSSLVAFVFGPLREFFTLRREIKQQMILFGNVRPRWKEDLTPVEPPLMPSEEMRLAEAQKVYRDCGARMGAFCESKPKTVWALRLRGYDPAKAAAGLIGMSIAEAVQGEDRWREAKAVEALATPLCALSRRAFGLCFHRRRTCPGRPSVLARAA